MQSPEPNGSYSYSIVIVTYNRLDFLKRCVEHARNQTYPPEHIVIVDNASTDGSGEFLDEEIRPDPLFLVYHEKENIGGAGGFHDGLRLAVKKTQSQWFLLIDDDALLDADCCEKMDPRKARTKTLAYASSVYKGEKLELYHRRNDRGAVGEEVYQNKEFVCKFISFCGIMLHRRLVEKIGYPYKPYFIWFDDTEYSLRMNRHTAVVVVTAAKLQHGDASKEAAAAAVDWKYYYGTRNHLDMLRRHKLYGQYLAFALEVRLIILLRLLRAVRHWNDPAQRKKDLYEAGIFRDARRDERRGRLGINRKYQAGNS